MPTTVMPPWEQEPQRSRCTCTAPDTRAGTAHVVGRRGLELVIGTARQPPSRCKRATPARDPTPQPAEVTMHVHHDHQGPTRHSKMCHPRMHRPHLRGSLHVEEKGVSARDVLHVHRRGLSPRGDERGRRDEVDGVPGRWEGEERQSGGGLEGAGGRGRPLVPSHAPAGV